MDYPVSPADKRARRGIVLAMSPKATGPAARADRSPLLSLAALGVVSASWRCSTPAIA